MKETIYPVEQIPTNTIPYSLTVEQVALLAALESCENPKEVQNILVNYDQDMKDLFSNFFMLSMSVTDNLREEVKLHAVLSDSVHPEKTDNMNLPSIMGAVAGVAISRFGCDEGCHSCAFTHGTAPNQSLPTVLDAVDCHAEDFVFMCHHAEDGKPKKACKGWAKMKMSGESK